MLNITDMVVWMAEIKLAVHDLLRFNAQIYKANCCEGMMHCADNQDTLFLSDGEGTGGHEQIAGDDQSGGSPFNRGELSVFAVAKHNEAAWFDIVRHRFRLHCSHQDAIAELAAPLDQHAALEHADDVLALQGDTVHSAGVEVIEEEFGEIFVGNNAMDFIFRIDDWHRTAIMGLEELACFQEWLVNMRRNNAAAHYIAHLEVDIFDGLWWLNLVTLKREAYLWFQFAIAARYSIIFALRLEELGIGVR